MKFFNEDYREFKLKNGLFVALQNTPTKTFSMQLNIDYGCAHEKEGEEGLAHFLEHCLISCGASKYNAEEAKKIFYGFGSSNAHTKNNLTNFVVDALREDLENSLEIVSSMVFSPRFEGKGMEEERQVVLREIADKKATPHYQDLKNFNRMILDKNSPFVKETLGKEEVIKSINQRDLIEFYAKGYNANNMQLVLVGDLPRDSEKMIQDYFGDKPSGKNLKFRYPLVDSLEKKVILHTSAPDCYNNENPNESSASLDLVLFIPPKTHEDRAGIGMLSNILGNGGDSLLFKKIREEKGLAYDINSEYDGRLNCGRFYISRNIKARRYEEAIDSIFEVFQKMKEKLIDNSFLECKKRQIKYGLTKLHESNKGHIDVIVNKMDYDFTPEDYISEISSLTPEKIQELANKYLPSKEDNYALLIRDPLKK